MAEQTETTEVVDTATVERFMELTQDYPDHAHSTLANIEKVLRGETAYPTKRYGALSLATAQAIRDLLKPMVERRAQLEAEMTAVLDEQRTLYAGNLTPEQKISAGQRYGELKRRERELTAELSVRRSGLR